MGFVKIFSRLLTAWVAYLYPCFASYKALSHRPLSEPDLERWVKYWSVMGALVGTEYALEWLISWFPFYWEVKTIFVLYLSLPQTQGSTFIYDTYFAPYFSRNEVELDRHIETARNSLVVFAQERLAALWNALWTILREAQAPPPTGQGVPPPAASPAVMLSNLWRAYAPTVIGGIANAAAAQNAAQHQAPPTQRAPFTAETE